LHSPVPAAVYIEDDFGSVLVDMLPFFLLVMFIPPVYNLVFLIVKEKESRARESMRMMGMTDFPYWLSWFLFYSAVNTAMVTLGWLTLVFNVITYSQSFWWWLFFWLYGECVFGQIVFTQSLFTRSKFAGLISTLIFFGASLANLTLQSESTPYIKKMLVSLLPQVAMCQIATVIAEYESTGVGIRWQNLNSPYLNYTYEEGMGMLVIDLVLFVVLGLWLDKILPKQYGQRESCCFCISPTYWGCCGLRRHRDIDDDETARKESLIDVVDHMKDQGENYEPDGDNFESKHMKKGNYEPISVETAKLELKNLFLMVRNLHKKYPSGLEAVKGINLKMYVGQIFALLGHNGAGKTSFISIITGLLERTKGQG
jgi:ATP-binding cassette subfamily A (ABC1) protein 3